MDERLRRAARDARARPDDATVSRMLAEEMARAGDRHGAWLTWCRLARGGDVVAWDELERRPVAMRARPGPGPRRLLRPAGLPVRCDAFAREALIFAGDVVSALDPTDLSTRWSAPVEGLGLAVACGPRVARVAADAGGSLVVHEALTGRELGRCRIGPPGARSVVERVESTADRVVVWARDGGPRGTLRVLTFDAGERPAASVAALRVREDVTPLAAMHGHLVCAEQGREGAKGGLLVSARPVDGGPPRWTVPGSLLAADARGALVVSWPEGGRYDPDPSILSELDLETGALRWRREGEPVRPGPVRLAPEVIVQASRLDARLALRPGDDVLEVRALERTDGQVRWRYNSMGHHTLLDVALARDVVYVAVAGVVVGGAGRPEIKDARMLGLDLETGAVLFAHTLELPMWWTPDGNRSRLALVPIDGAALVVAADKQTTTIDRFA